MDISACETWPFDLGNPVMFVSEYTDRTKKFSERERMQLYSAVSYESRKIKVAYMAMPVEYVIGARG